MKRSACVIGAGPNGLAAAIAIAQAGLPVEVFEAEATAGGAVRTMELTLPGFRHDFGAAVFPLGIGSPFFSQLPLHQHGLSWIHSPAPLAHPLDDGTAVILERDLGEAKLALGPDGVIWEDLHRPFVEHWPYLAEQALQPPVPRFLWRPLLMARFGMYTLRSAEKIASRFTSGRTRALFAGLSAHSFLALDEPLSGIFGLLMSISAHAVGWPIAAGGSQSLANALCGYLSFLGGVVNTSTRVQALAQVGRRELLLCDVTPKQLLTLAGSRLSESYKRRMMQFRYGPGVFKMDYALSSPIPWKASECGRAATVHIGGSFEEIAESEKAAREGRHCERPFMILVQPSLFDSSRAPAGKHTAWAYCHVPNGSNQDMLPRMEAQIERFAPGFRECVLARHVLSPSGLEALDSNLVGGDIQGGSLDLRQFLFRPTWRHYKTSAPGVFLCSASTPPGGGVHGMCGYHAAQQALESLA